MCVCLCVQYIYMCETECVCAVHLPCEIECLYVGVQVLCLIWYNIYRFNTPVI